MLALAPGGHQQAGQHTVGVGALMRAGAKTNFSKDHQVAQGLFGLVVGGLNIGVFEESKQALIFFLGIEQSVFQSFGVIIGKFG